MSNSHIFIIAANHKNKKKNRKSLAKCSSPHAVKINSGFSQKQLIFSGAIIYWTSWIFWFKNNDLIQFEFSFLKYGPQH